MIPDILNSEPGFHSAKNDFCPIAPTRVPYTFEKVIR